MGLRNGGATCYMNAVFQQLFMQPSIRALVLGAKEEPEPLREDSPFFQLQAISPSTSLLALPGSHGNQPRQQQQLVLLSLRAACAGVQKMFGYLALSYDQSFRPHGFWKAFKDYDGEPINVREHQDAYEFFTRLQVRCLTTTTTSFLSRRSQCFLPS